MVWCNFKNRIFGIRHIRFREIWIRDYSEPVTYTKTIVDYLTSKLKKKLYSYIDSLVKYHLSNYLLFTRSLQEFFC